MQFQEVRLTVVPKPDEFSGRLLDYEAGTTESVCFIGGGRTNLICGNCSALLAKSVHRDQFIGFTFHCPSCGSYGCLTVGNS